MICIELSFTDDPRRLTARPAHRERLGALHDRGSLIMAGPWHDGSGALLVFDLDESDVRKELTDDPYYSTPGVEVAAVRQWDPVVGTS